MTYQQAVLFIRLIEVIKLRARSRSSTYQDIAEGLLTPPVKIGGRSVAWPRHEIDALNAARLAGNSEYEIRQLVVALQAARKGEAQ